MPLIIPSTSPSPMPKAHAACVDSRWFDNAAATVNATRPMTASTDRSTLRVMTTIASPTAAIAMIAASTETSVRLDADRTCGARIATRIAISPRTSGRLSSRWRAAAPRSRLTGLVVVGAASAAASDTGRPRGVGRPRARCLGVVAVAVARGDLALRRRGVHDGLLGRVRSRDLRGDGSLMQNEDPIRHREDFRKVAGDQDDGEARRRQLRDDPMDLDLRADVDASSGLIQDQHAGLGRQPFPEHHLLLIAPG